MLTRNYLNDALYVDWVLIPLLAGGEDSISTTTTSTLRFIFLRRMQSNKKQSCHDMGDSSLIISVFRTVVEGNNRWKQSKQAGYRDCRNVFSPTPISLLLLTQSSVSLRRFRAQLDLILLLLTAKANLRDPPPPPTPRIQLLPLRRDKYRVDTLEGIFISVCQRVYALAANQSQSKNCFGNSVL